MPIPTLVLDDGVVRAPWIAFGTGTALFGRDATHVITIAIQSGFTHLDGAQSYRNEASLGVGTVASGKLRSELYITTGLGALGAKAAGLTKSIGVLNFATGHLGDIL